MNDSQGQRSGQMSGPMSRNQKDRTGGVNVF